MRIYLIEASGKGGLIHYAYHLARGLARTGAEVTLVTSNTYELRGLEHPFRVVELLVLWDPRTTQAIHPLWRKLRRGGRGLQYLYQWVRLVRFLQAERPDVVLFGEIRFGFERYLLAWLRRSHLLLADIVHDVESYDTRQGSEAILNQSEGHLRQYTAIYQQFDALFVHDRSNRERFLHLYPIAPDKVYQIPMATNELVLEVAPAFSPSELRQHLGLPTDKPIVLFFGTLTKYKGLEDLILAFPAVQGAAQAHLLVAGFPAKDISAAQLQALAQEKGIGDAVTWFLDYVPNEWVAPMMALSSVVVLPYRAITQSAVIQIAYACGRPVVGTRVGGLPDIIEEGQSGMLAEPQNPDSLAAALIALLTSPRLDEIGRYARHLADTHYSWDRVAQLIQTAIQEKLN